ncbi:MAG: ABC transporter ATP-binding protein [Pseudomonadota bacterium]
MTANPGAMDVQPLVAFRGVSKSYDGRSDVVADLDLAVRRGEFLTLLGPSGSGKTTTLMMLAGFEAPDRGDILLDGRSLAQVPPYRRNMGVVFQSYALFPHMSVARNLAFPLEVRDVARPDIAARVARALDLVHLDGLADRRINQLSGGQQQRVALARALIFDPDLVLMDEPLGALDRQLREKLQGEIRRIQRQTGVTIVYVTHDQSEALALSDRIAVFAHGKVQQLDTPQAIYERPANAFVAGFIGDNNCLPGTVTERDRGLCTVKIAGDLTVRAQAVGAVAPGDAALLAVRPEAMVLGRETSLLANRFDAEIEECVFHGDHSNLRIRLPGGATVTARGDGLQQTGSVSLGWSAEAAGVFAAPDGAVVPQLEEVQ